ncbi:MAG: TolC family protein [Gammaproteobacteria bacterium]
MKSSASTFLTETRKAFTQVLAAQERRRLAKELASVAEKVHRSVHERVKAGRVSPLEETKAEVATANSRLQLKRAVNALEAARVALAVLWGDTEARFERAQGEIGVLAPIPALDEIQHLITRNPSVARWVAEIEQRRVAITLAEAKRVPDITLSAGVRQFIDTGDTAFVTGFSVPLPVFDRNDRGIQGSLYRFRQAQEEERVVEVKARTQLERDHRILTTAHEEILTLRYEILPAAERAFEAANEGYRHGKFSYLEVLDAQRTLFETHLRYLGALTAYHIAAAELERLIGVGLAQLAPARDVKKGGDR